jgi:hypothetical protein
MSSESGTARKKPRSSNIPGIGGTTGKALALSIVGVTVYGLIKLVDLVTD